MYRIVTDEAKVRWYWAGKNWWTSFGPNAKPYATEGIAQSALTRMSIHNKSRAYIQEIKSHPTKEQTK